MRLKDKWLAKPKIAFRYGIFPVIFLAIILLFTQISSPKEIASGDVDPDNADQIWAGTLGPAAVGSGSSDVDLVSNVTIAQNPVTGVFNANLSAGQTSGFIRSKVIDVVPSGSLKTWKELQLGISRPVGTTTSFTVDVLCGSSAEGCILNQTLLANVPLTNDEYVLPASLNSKTKIKIQVNFSRPDTVNPTTALYSWQVQWEVNAGVSLVVSKSTGNPIPNTANPELLNGSYPGVNNYNQVVYNASYSLNRSVQNLRIVIPFPLGTYTPAVGSPKTYTSSYIGSSGSNTCQTTGGVTVSCTSGSAARILFNLGNKASGTVGSVSVTLKINSGPPNGVIFKTRPIILGDDYSPQVLPDDVLNIESKAFAGSLLIAPEYVAANRDTYFIARMATAGSLFQSDMFNARYVLDYSATTCYSNSVVPVLYGSGATSVNVDAAGRKITFNLANPVTLPTPSLTYVVKLRANSSCSTPAGIATNMTFFSDQDSSFVLTKTLDAQYYTGPTLPKFDSSDVLRHSLGLQGPGGTVGAGQRVDYNLQLNQRTTFPTANFWAMFRIPDNATFVAARLVYGPVTAAGAIPNNWRIYYSTASAASPPARNSGTWTELTNGTPGSTSIPPCGGPYGCFPSPAPGSKINWVKWELGGNAFNWDRLTNFDPVMGQVTVVTDSNASGTVVSQAYSYSGGTCLASPCPLTHSVGVSNQPYFNVLQTPCLVESSTDVYQNCGNITASSGGSYFVTAHVANTHEGPSISRGDATNVKVRIRVPDRQFLDPAVPIDLSAADGPHARCSTASPPSFNNDTNCPNASGVNQNPAPWLNPSTPLTTTCPPGGSGSCTVEWDIPIIYSSEKFPQTLPYHYSFYIRLNVRSGLIDQTKICENGLGPCNVNVFASTPAASNANLPKLSPYTVTVASSPTLSLVKTLTPGYSSPITYQTATRFRLNYRNLPPSTGSVGSVTIIDRLPIYTDVQPPARLNLDPSFLPNNPAAAPNGEVAYYKLQDPAFPRTSDTPPPKNDPGWVQFTSTFNPALIPLIDWVKWERNTLFPVHNPPSEDGDDFVDLGLVDAGSPNETVFTNKAFLVWTTGMGDQTAESNSQVRIDTPGFTTTTQGNVGSVGFLGSSIDLKPPSGTQLCNSAITCHTNYLGISGQAFNNDFFTSYKDWLVPNYDFAAEDNPALKTDYNKMWEDYKKDAVNCSDEENCLQSTKSVVRYAVSGGNTLKINTVGGYANATYTGVPKIVFVDGGGNGSNDALEINTDMRTAVNTGLIFVVNGNVKVSFGVTHIEGVFLVEGQFSTGRRTQVVSNGQAGQFATISIGRDGFARIAYVSGDNVRFIKCLDLNCTAKDYGYVTTVEGEDVVSVSMGLFETSFGPTIDYPKIVVGMRNDEGATTKFISCYDKDTSVNGHKEGETCLDNDTVVYPDANDPDIIVAPDGIPGYTFGVGPNSNKALTMANCRLYYPEPPVNDRNCPNPTLTTLDGGSGVNKGNETNYTVDATTGAFGSLVATYVDRSAGRSDLWFAKMRYDNLGTGCSGVTNWDCRRLVGSAVSPGNVGGYHSSHTAPNGLTYIYYQDSNTREIKYLQCTDKPCTATLTRVVDCTASCTGQSYVTASKVLTNYIVYNVVEGGNNAVKMAYCANPSQCIINPWVIQNISNTPLGAGGYQTTDARVYTQGIAGGRTVENNFPRVVFFDYSGDNQFLIYLRCTDSACTQSGRVYSFIDDGTAVSLPDKQLTLDGSVSAYGASLSGTEQAINLQRDLFGESKSKPGEIFALQPKYYYVFRNVLKEPQKTAEAPP